MDKKNLIPQMAQPVNRTTTGQLPPELAELSEEALQLKGARSSVSVLPSAGPIERAIDARRAAEVALIITTTNPLEHFQGLNRELTDAEFDSWVRL